MTIINANIFKSGTTTPLGGYIDVTAEATFSADPQYYVPVTQRFNLTSGVVSFDLAPSDVAKVSYRFDIYETVPDIVVEGQPVVVPDSLVKSFYALVPLSASPINIKDLATQTGLRYDQQDSSLLTLSRYLVTSDTFWSALNSYVWQHRGTYLPNTFYKRGDVVVYDGSGYQYIAQVATENNLPTNTTYWRLLAQKGDTGAGTTGNNTAYGIAWDGSTDAPSRNAVYDIIQTLASQSQLATKADLASPIFTGNPEAPTQSPGNSSNRLATTAFISTAIDNVGKVPVGSICIWSTTSAPSKYRVLTNPGETVSRTTFSTLFALLGTTYNTGGEAGTDFRLPSTASLPSLPSSMRYIIYTGV